MTSRGFRDPVWQARLDLLADLVERSSHQQDDAFAELYDLTSRRVFEVVLKVVRSSDLAAEVTQEVYLDVWRQAARFSVERGDVMAWVLTIAHRRAVDCLRSVVSQGRRDTGWCELDIARGYDQASEAAERHGDVERVRAGLTTLTVVQREALVLAYFGGFTHREVADRLQVPLGTVKTRIRTAMCVLRTTIH